MKIADNVEMLEIAGEHGTLYPVLIWDETEVVLIDAALPGQTGVLRVAVEKAGFTLDKITKVILTHHDLDHIGSAKTFAGMGAGILAHKDEAPYIQGEITSIRLADMESRLSELTDGERAFYERAKQGAPMFYVNIDKLLHDGDTLDYCGGITVIHTPGHTPGHIMLLLKQSNIIVAGDGANIVDDSLTGANPQYTRDMGQAQKSLDKMMGFKPDAVVCYHGGYIRRQYSSSACELYA